MYTAWMLRQDGVSFPVKFHLYSECDSDLTSEAEIASFLIKTKSKDIGLAKRVIDTWLALLIEEYVSYDSTPNDIILIMKEQLNNLPYEFKYPLTIDEILKIHKEEYSYSTFDELYDFIYNLENINLIGFLKDSIRYSLNQQFCRVRFGGMYNTYVKNNDIWFRISSTFYNWYDVILNFLKDKESKYPIEKITICRDNESDNGIDKSGPEHIYKIIRNNGELIHFKKTPYKVYIDIIENLDKKEKSINFSAYDFEEIEECKEKNIRNFYYSAKYELALKVELSKGKTYLETIFNGYSSAFYTDISKLIKEEIDTNCDLVDENGNYTAP